MKVSSKSFSLKPADVERKWYVIDATGVPLGRLSTEVASLLIGKGKPTVTPHVDGGDYVVIINAAKIKVTGKKSADKIYYRHSGYPGGIKQRTLSEQQDKDPTVVITKAIRGMLPVNKLRDGRLARLKIYAEAEHQHTAQIPEPYTLKGAKS